MVTSAAEISEPSCAEHLDNFQSQDRVFAKLRIQLTLFPAIPLLQLLV